jgi:plasmid replication initiation protein
MQSKITTTQHDKPRTSRQVVQSYLFTTAVYDFNVYEKRIIYNLVRLAQSQLEGVKLSDSLYKIDHAYKDYLVVELPISDFLTDQDDKNHSRIKAALKSLHQKTFTYQEDGVWECFSIIANPKIRLRSSKVSFIVDSRVWDVLLNFTKGFSRYDLEIAFKLESTYSMRFYELLAGQKEPIAYSIDNLRKEFKLDGKYKLNKDFIRRVVESAKNELDLKSPVTFTFRPLKEGKKITRIMFYPLRQEDKEPQDTFFKEIIRKYGSSAHLSSEEKRLLVEIGFSEIGIRNNLELFMECKKRLDFIYELALIVGKSRDKNNPCGWCIKTLIGKLKDLE